MLSKEDILDVMETLENMGINQKASRLWYKLNQGTEIKVKTGVGLTEQAEVGPLVGQGSTGAAVASQAMIDMGLKQYFASSSDEMYYGGVRFETAAYQDDIAKPSGDARTAQAGVTKLATMLEERGLEAHEDKTGYILMGNEKYKAEMKVDLEANPLQMRRFEVKRKQQDKYLGQILHEGGLRKSVEATIKDRIGKIKGAIFLTAQIVDSFEMQAMGGLMSVKHLWEGAIVPSLLSGAGTWVSISSKEEEMCEELQELFWRTVLQVPRGGPKVMLRAETGSMKMKHRIQKQKLMLARKIRSQNNSLANAIYEEQLYMGWPGLAMEAAEICTQIGVTDVNKESVGKGEIDDGIFYSNYKDVKTEMERYEKLEDIKHEDFRKEQAYMHYKSVEKARLAYRIRTKLVNRVKMNFKNMYKENVNCDTCKDQKETQDHVMTCPRWEDERRGLDLMRMEDMVTFFNNILKEK